MVSSPFQPKGAVTSHFSNSRWLFGKWAPHWGTDVASPVGGRPALISATADGVVAAAGTGVLKWHSGNIVVIRHNGFHTVTCHLHSFSVRAGQSVKAGQVIGVEGQTGNVTGRHLHIGVYVGGRYERGDLAGGSWVDPYPWFRSRGITLGVTHPVKPKTTAAAKPKPKPKAKPGALPSNREIQVRLSRAGLYKGAIDGVRGRVQVAAVKTYQRLNGLVPDGVWGRLTENAYLSRVRIQQALNRMKGWKVAVDGHMPDRGLTRKRIVDVKRRNKWPPYTTGFTPAFKRKLIAVGAWK